MKNVIEYKEGVSFLSNNSNWESKVESGKGNAFGVEFFLEKRLGNFNGWIGYTLAKSDRTFPTINNGEVFPYKFDRRHDISVVLNYKIDDHWDVSATWVYGTGNAITLSTVEFLGNNGDFQDIHLQSYNKRNGFRSAAYHRMDIGFNHSKVTKWGSRTWSFGLYNAYNRKNPFYYQITHDNQGQKALERVSLFPLIPSVSYSFKIGK
jgi:hypothetical protein